MTPIAKNDFYTLRVDAEKNRIYYKVVGYWPSPLDVPNFLTDIKKSLRLVQKGFTMLLDFTAAEVHPSDVEKLRVEAQRKLVKAGLFKAARVVSVDFTTGLQMELMSSKSKMKYKDFRDMEEAEEWLDRKTKKLSKKKLKKLFGVF